MGRGGKGGERTYHLDGIADAISLSRRRVVLEEMFGGEK